MSVNQSHNQMVRLSLAGGSETTELVLGRGVLGQAADLLAAHRRARLLIVSDQRVAPLYAAPLRDTLAQAGYDAHLATVPSGEGAKTLETLHQLYQTCFELRLERSDPVVAVGGGVVGDLAGMLAGTFLRGLPLVQAPTTLVAQVTASSGGKVGVNFQSAKNMIGMFKLPELILADLATLDTLPPVEFRSGLGELVTVGVLGAPAIFEALEARGAADLGPLVAAAVECKSRIVAADPFDRLGLRAQLNLGHTFGHALEQASGFGLAHGLAVAVGLHVASRLGAALGLCPEALCDRIYGLLRALDLPAALTGYDPQELMRMMRNDKKRVGGRLRWVVPVALGRVVLVGEDEVPPGTVEAILRELVGGRAA